MCAAFVQVKLDKELDPITHKLYQEINKTANPDNIFGSDLNLQEVRDNIMRLAEQYQFFHWHLAFPDVFCVPKNSEQPENEQTGWSGGFDVVLGNPPWNASRYREKEWFAQKRPDITNATNAAQRRRMISALSYEDPTLFQAFVDAQRQSQGESHFIRNSERYPLCDAVMLTPIRFSRKPCAYSSILLGGLVALCHLVLLLMIPPKYFSRTLLPHSH